MSHHTRPSAASSAPTTAATSWRNDWSFWFRLSMIAAFLICAGTVKGQTSTPEPTGEAPAPPVIDIPATSQETDESHPVEKHTGESAEAAEPMPVPPPVTDAGDGEPGPAVAEDAGEEASSAAPLPPMVSPQKLTVPPPAAPTEVADPETETPARSTDPLRKKSPNKPADSGKGVLGGDLKPEKKPAVEPTTPMPLPAHAKPADLGGAADPTETEPSVAEEKMPLPEETVEEKSPIAAPEPVVKEEQPKPEPSESVVEAPASPKADDDETSSWSILITPGKQFVSPQDKADRITTFKLDSQTGRMISGPEEKVLGPQETYHKPETVSPAGHHEGARFPAQSPDVSNYQQIYDSIPYSRAEYLANPGYRHDATMEILFGEMRPTTIHKEDTPRRIYNLPPIHEDPRVQRRPLPYGYGPNNYLGYYYGPGMGYRFGYGPYWTPNSTYRRSATVYGPLFYRYYRPLRGY